MTGPSPLILLEPRPRPHPLGWLLSAGAAGAVLSGLAALALAAQRPADSAGDQPETPVVIMLAPPPAPAPEPVAAPAPLAEAEPPAEPVQPETAEAPPDPTPPEPAAPEPAPVQEAAPDPVPPQPPAAVPPEALAIRPVPRPSRRAEPASRQPLPRQTTASTDRRAAPQNPAQAEPAPRRQAAVSAGAGRRAEASYRAQVLRRIRMTPKRPAPQPGVAVVGFSVGPSGQLDGVRVLRSSGSAALDRLALDHIRRAAPFPAPPDGAARDFTLNFLGK